MYLSKNDFKIAQTCPAKLYYEKSEYPNTTDKDPYLQLLANGGFMIEEIAKLLQPKAIRLNYNHEDFTSAFCSTQNALQENSVILCEATLIHDMMIARVDILRKHGAVFDLVEVKAKSYDSNDAARAIRDGHPSIFRKKDGSIKSDWQEYLEDVTFQVIILKALYPESTVRPFLCMPDKSKTTRIEDLPSLFELRRIEDPSSNFVGYEVNFSGDVEQLRADNFLVEVSVAEEVEFLTDTVHDRAQAYVKSMAPKLQKIGVPLSTDCRSCEYRDGVNGVRDGFRKCWGVLADVQPHILDLYQAGKAGGENGQKVNDLIQERKVSLFDVTEDDLKNSKGQLGVFGKRQMIQIRHTRDNTEWIDPQLKTLLASYSYPLHFIDFETTAMAVPYHAGMHPYEHVAFQWSCHTIPSPGADPVHSEWINTQKAFPNFGFAEALMEQIGTDGTVFKYASHESLIMKAILVQMEGRSHRNPRLQKWLEEMSAKDRIVDMYQTMVLKHYYHPIMKGRNSIKRVLDAIWKIDPQIRSKFPQYLRVQDGEIASPYAALPPLIIQGKETVVAEGTGAVRAYEAMMYGLERNNSVIRDQWRDLLLQYCKLDTLAMVMLWMHWTGPQKNKERR